MTNKTLDQLSAITTPAGTDLQPILRPASGVLQYITWSNIVAALTSTFTQKANNLSDVADAATSRTNLGLGTAATQATGTSGATVPLLNGANTWAAGQTFSGGLTGTLTGAATSAATATTAPASDNTTKIANTNWLWTNIQTLVQSCIAAVASAAGFTFSSGGVGYIKFPSWLGGFIVQWQSGAVSAGTIIAWPIGFPNTVFAAVAIPLTASVTSYGVNAANFNTSNVQVYPNSGGAGVTINITVLSVGY